MAEGATRIDVALTNAQRAISTRLAVIMLLAKTPV